MNRIVRRLCSAAFVAAIATFILGTTSGRAESNTGVAQGTIINASTGKPVAGTTVTVQTFKKMERIDLQELMTDAEGRFQVAGLANEPDNRYIVKTTYAGISYSLKEAINPAAAQEAVKLFVYDTTTSTDGISIASISIAITSVDGATGLIQVLEYATFKNATNLAFVGSLVSDPQKGGVLRIPLPNTTLDLELGDGFSEAGVVTGPSEMITRDPVHPGTLGLLYAYKIPFTTSSTMMSRGFIYPIDKVVFLTAQNGPSPSSPLLTSAETVNINGKSNFSLSAQNLKPGTPITVTLDGLPKLRPPGAGLSSDTALRGIGIGLMALSTVAVGVYALMLRRRPLLAAAGVAADPLAEERRGLMRAAAELDSRFKAGGVAKGAYEDARRKIKLRLTDVSLLLDERAAPR